MLQGSGTCPFGNKCFYRHCLPDGKTVDVGEPTRPTRLMNSLGELERLQVMSSNPYKPWANLDISFNSRAFCSGSFLKNVFLLKTSSQPTATQIQMTFLNSIRKHRLRGRVQYQTDSHQFSNQNEACKCYTTATLIKIILSVWMSQHQDVWTKFAENYWKLSRKTHKNFLSKLFAKWPKTWNEMFA